MSPSAPDLASIGDALHRLTRTIQRRKAQLAAENGDSDWAAHQLLDHLLASGPMRAAALAESTLIDPSTASRHVAALVRDGLVERHADPIDGRASLLVITDEGRRTVEDRQLKRAEWIAELVGDWSAKDRAELARLMEKFTLALESQQPAPVAAPVLEGSR